MEAAMKCGWCQTFVSNKNLALNSHSLTERLFDSHNSFPAFFVSPSFPHQKPSSHIPFFVTHGIFVALSFEMNLFQTLTVKLKLLGHHGFSRTGTKRSHLQNSRLRNLPSQTLRSRRRLKVRLFLGDRFQCFPYHLTSLQPYPVV